MADSYQAIYDAVRSRVYNGDVGQAIENAMHQQNISFYFERASNMAMDVLAEYSRPSTIYKPQLSIDGNMWCAMYGRNPMEGVCGFGKSPEAAFAEFDKEWCKSLLEEAAGNG